LFSPETKPPSSKLPCDNLDPTGEEGIAMNVAALTQMRESNLAQGDLIPSVPPYHASGAFPAELIVKEMHLQNPILALQAMSMVLQPGHSANLGHVSNPFLDRFLPQELTSYGYQYVEADLCTSLYAPVLGIGGFKPDVETAARFTALTMCLTVMKQVFVGVRDVDIVNLLYSKLTENERHAMELIASSTATGSWADQPLEWIQRDSRFRARDALLRGLQLIQLQKRLTERQLLTRDSNVRYPMTAKEHEFQERSNMRVSDNRHYQIQLWGRQTTGAMDENTVRTQAQWGTKDRRARIMGSVSTRNRSGRIVTAEQNTVATEEEMLLQHAQYERGIRIAAVNSTTVWSEYELIARTYRRIRDHPDLIGRDSLRTQLDRGYLTASGHFSCMEVVTVVQERLAATQRHEERVRAEARISGQDASQQGSQQDSSVGSQDSARPTNRRSSHRDDSIWAGGDVVFPVLLLFCYV
jgi:hypothetical protein